MSGTQKGLSSMLSQEPLIESSPRPIIINRHRLVVSSMASVCSPPHAPSRLVALVPLRDTAPPPAGVTVAPPSPHPGLVELPTCTKYLVAVTVVSVVRRRLRRRHLPTGRNCCFTIFHRRRHRASPRPQLSKSHGGFPETDAPPTGGPPSSSRSRPRLCLPAMTGIVLTSRYSAEDLETASMHSTAPSYVSDAPSYHSNPPYPDSAPAYAPRAAPTSPTRPPPMLLDAGPPSPDANRSRSVGLPPIPPALPQNIVCVHNFRLPTWSANNAPAARHYRNVAERRISDGRYKVAETTIRRPVLGDTAPSPEDETSTTQPRPLEDPYLVGEVAAAQARRERLAREDTDDILVREDRQWDWLLAHMKVCDERQKNLTKFRQTVDTNQRKTLLHRIGGRLLPSTLI
ncbi:hypothetical protein XA68_14098 [Ophiocordyceps unilateralis]|uniref:Uncharacterized protein n=1 Tax=Ophiocordyceps unilateralis TaxID=268505 RepID=A0A2A9PBF1_OPHUN|nr:hypothetical protein XA68_14098 [Ophiocordyceps unilateralis]